MKNTTLDNIMTKAVVTVEMDDKISLVKEIFDNSKFHHLLVMEEGKLFGVVSDRDLLKSISPNIGTMVVTFKDMATLQKRVHQIMSRKPITLMPHNTVADAAELFNTHSISCIPIVNSESRPVGIVTWRDMMRTLLPNKQE